VRGLRSWHRISAVSIGRPAYPQEFSSCPREAGINSVLQLFVGVWLSVLFPARPEQFDRPSTNGAASDPRAADAHKFDLPNVRPPSRIFRHHGSNFRSAPPSLRSAGARCSHSRWRRGCRRRYWGAKLIWGKVLDLVLGGGLVVKQLRQLEGRPFFGACPEARRACGGIVASVGRRPPIASVSDLHATARGGFRTRLAPFSLHVDWSDRMEGAD